METGETGTENRRVLFEVEVLGRSHGRRCFVCDSPAWPMHTVRPRGGDYGRYACFVARVRGDDHLGRPGGKPGSPGR